MSKKFIEIGSMKDELLKQIQETFLNTEFFNSDSIDIKLSLKDIVDKQIEEKKLTEPKIYILDTAWLKIQTLVKENNAEVAWHCLVERHTDNRYLIYDVLVFPQEVTGVTANGIDGEYEMWVATLPDEQFDYLRCHMHSHVNMGVTPSSTDENYYANLMTQVTDYYITMIINKSNAYTLRFYDKVNNIMWSDLSFTICTKEGITYTDWYDSVKDMIKTKEVKSILPQQESIFKPSYSGYGSSRYSDNYYDDYDYQYSPNTHSRVSDSWDFSNSKKKETTASKKTTSKVKEVVLASPTGECLVFRDVNEATNYIYKYYEKQIIDYKAFQRNQIRTRLAHDETLYINRTTLEFIDDDDIIDEQAMDYVIQHCDVWEVQ